jgi:hypothetical protein
MVWEAGFWDGDDWVEGFWRPASRSGFRWIDAGYRDDGVWEAGYWEPLAPRSGHVWVPGWYDGGAWQDGYWVTEAEYDAANPDAWTPPEGARDGWDAAPSEPPAGAVDADDVPLALPADGVR